MTMPESSKPTSPPRKPAAWWVWPLLSAPYLGLCFPALYARATPEFFGFPFFYWYQFASVIATSAMLYIVYRQFKSN